MDVMKADGTTEEWMVEAGTPTHCWCGLHQGIPDAGQ
jgi:hypothetical protein